MRSRRDVGEDVLSALQEIDHEDPDFPPNREPLFLIAEALVGVWGELQGMREELYEARSELEQLKKVAGSNG